jgi:pyruvate dehydrogenase E2 component (dihydrolipoamide acetyltransferase)
MATPVIMPKQGQSVETCIITSWLKKKGEVVHIGDILFSYETDKAAFDMESTVDGILLDIFYDAGAEVPVLVNVAVIGSEGEDYESIRTGKAPGTGETVTSKQGTGETPAATISQAGIEIQKNGDTRFRISPRAKRLAEDKGVDFNSLNGSGPGGRIIVKDIENALISRTAHPEAGGLIPETGFTDQPLSNVRKLIAKAMHASLQNSAQLTHHMSADVRKLLEARKKIKEDLATGKAKQDITINDMICWCVIRALKEHPEANSQFLDDKIRIFHKVHLGLAVDTSRGLMVPAIKNADDLELVQLSKELKSSAEACRKGNINPELLYSTAASFTVSNLGNYGVEMFTPVINLPQVCILGVCTITYRPADIGNGVFGFIPTIGLSLTYDHRAIDGGPATMFLKEIRKQIEDFRYDDKR